MSMTWSLRVVLRWAKSSLQWFRKRSHSSMSISSLQRIRWSSLEEQSSVSRVATSRCNFLRKLVDELLKIFEVRDKVITTGPEDHSPTLRIRVSKFSLTCSSVSIRPETPSLSWNLSFQWGMDKASFQFRLSAIQIQIWSQYSVNQQNSSFNCSFISRKRTLCNQSSSCSVIGHQELRPGIQLSHFVIRGQHCHSDRSSAGKLMASRLGTSRRSSTVSSSIMGRKTRFSQNMFQLQFWSASSSFEYLQGQFQKFSSKTSSVLISASVNLHIIEVDAGDVVSLHALLQQQLWCSIKNHKSRRVSGDHGRESDHASVWQHHWAQLHGEEVMIRKRIKRSINDDHIITCKDQESCLMSCSIHSSAALSYACSILFIHLINHLNLSVQPSVTGTLQPFQKSERDLL